MTWCPAVRMRCDDKVGNNAIFVLDQMKNEFLVSLCSKGATRVRCCHDQRLAGARKIPFSGSLRDGNIPDDKFDQMDLFEYVRYGRIKAWSLC